MIRLASPEDSRFVSDVGVATGMFPESDTSVTDNNRTRSECAIE